MDARDRKLLDRQLAHVVPPPRNDGVLMLAIAAVFFAGIAVGGFVFASQDAPPQRTAATVPSAASVIR